MNILEDMKVLLIEPSTEHITRYVNELWKLAGEVRTDLGKKGYYLDQYLSTVMEVLSNLDLTTAAAVADDICWSILGDCYILLETKENKKKSEFFDMVKDYIEKNPANFDETHEKVEFYTANILIERLSFFSDKARNTYRKKVLSGVDYIFPNEMYEKMSDIIGEKRFALDFKTSCSSLVLPVFPILFNNSSSVI